MTGEAPGCAQTVHDLCERSQDYYDQWHREAGIGETSRAVWKARALEAASALEALRADNERLRGMVDACAEYLKEGETPRQRMDRDHAEALGLMKVLARVTARAERAEASLAGQDAEIAKAVAAETERCAKLLDERAAACRTNAEFWETHKKPDRQETFEAMADECEDAATAIRARAQEPRS